jgi:hypothetical protein
VELLHVIGDDNPVTGEPAEGWPEGEAPTSGGEVPTEQAPESRIIPDQEQKQIDDFAYYTSTQEKVYVYDTEGNIVGTATAGSDRYSVDLSNIPDNKLEDASLLHNHPAFNTNEKDGSFWVRDTWTFSETDIQMATDNNLGQIIATGEKNTFVMDRPSGGWGNFDEIMDKVAESLSLDRDFIDTAAKFRDSGNSSELNNLSKTIWEEYASISGANYREIKR